MRRGFWLFLFTFIAVVLLASPHMPMAQAVLPELSIDKVVTEVGDTVLVNVTLSNVISCGGWMTGIAWDPYIADITLGGPNSNYAGNGVFVDVVEGPFLKSRAPTFLLLNSVDNEKGEAVVGVLFQTPGEVGVSGTGVILTLNFTIVHPGTTTIEFKPPFTNKNASMVVDPSQQREISHIEVNGLITAHALLVGDINDDGIVNRYDATLLANTFGSKLGDPNWNVAADLNGDNVVNILDAIILANHFLQHIA
jgi:hypothetical protein